MSQRLFLLLLLSSIICSLLTPQKVDAVSPPPSRQQMSQDKNSALETMFSKVNIPPDSKAEYIQLLSNDKVSKNLKPLLLSSKLTSRAGSRAGLMAVLTGTLAELENKSRVSSVQDFRFANQLIKGLSQAQMETIWAVQVAYILYGEVHKVFPWSILTLPEDNLTTLLQLCARDIYFSNLNLTVGLYKNTEYCGSQFWKTKKTPNLFTMQKVWAYDPKSFFEFAKKFVDEMQPKDRNEAMRMLPAYLFEKTWEHPSAAWEHLFPYLPLPNPFVVNKLPSHLTNNAFQSLDYVEVEGETPALMGEDMFRLRQVSCQEGSHLFQMVFRMMGIPMLPVDGGGHWGMYFPKDDDGSKGYWVSHTDNFYTYLSRISYPNLDYIFYEILPGSPLTAGQGDLKSLSSCDEQAWLRKGISENLMTAWDNGSMGGKETVQRIYCATDYFENKNPGDLLNKLLKFSPKNPEQNDCSTTQPGDYYSGTAKANNFLASVASVTDCNDSIYSENKELFKTLYESSLTCKNVSDIYDQTNPMSVILYRPGGEPIEIYERYCLKKGIEAPTCLNQYDPSVAYNSSYSAKNSYGWVTTKKTACSFCKKTNGIASCAKP